MTDQEYLERVTSKVTTSCPKCGEPLLLEGQEIKGAVDKALDANGEIMAAKCKNCGNPLFVRSTPDTGKAKKK